jgi:hypothetical protein
MRALDAAAVDERSVGRLEVDDREFTPSGEDARVGARDTRLGDDEIVGLGASDRDLSFVERVDLAGFLAIL